MRTLSLWVGLAALVAAMLWWLARTPRLTEPAAVLTSDESVALAAMNRLLPRDAIAPIYRPRFVAAAQARLRPDELVLGVAINGEAKAYPITILNSREMVNDTAGGVPILATW
jgi:hypothetical protein